MIEQVLGTAGCDVTLVANGQQALDTLAARTFDIVLMDVNMPVLNGVDAARLYRFASRGRVRTPIVALTADATDDARRRCLEAGMDECLTKPLDPRALLALITRLTSPEPLEGSATAPAELDGAPRRTKGATLDENALAMLDSLGGPDFAATIAEQFVADGRALMAEIRAAIRAADADAFGDRTHALRSAAANVGAQAVFQLCLGWRSATEAELREHGPAMARALSRELRRAEAALGARTATRGGRQVNQR